MPKEELLWSVGPEEEDDALEWDMSPGELEIYVSMNHAYGTKGAVFEYEATDWSGCVSWMREGIGIDYWLEECTDIPSMVKAGRTYVIHDIEVHFTRGDGWTTDDDEDWYYGRVEERFEFLPWLKQTLVNAWWLTLGYRIRNWRAKK